MTRVLPRTNFHSSTLIRSLTELALADAADPGNAFAEKLGLWIHFTDAITLSAVHADGMASLPKTQPGEHADIRATAGAEFERMQALLAKSIVESCSPGARKTHIRLPAPDIELPMNFKAAYAPYRRFYEAHQRDMDASIQPLRVNVREAVAKASPQLRKLAELDATFEKILRDRERQLLSKVPVLLAKRFEQLFKEHQQKLAEAGQEDKPAAWTQAGGWLARFCNDMQMLLLAEAEFRLQPVLGLIEACNEENKQGNKQDTQ